MKKINKRTSSTILHNHTEQFLFWALEFLSRKNDNDNSQMEPYVDGLGHKPSNSEFSKNKKFHKITRDQVIHHV